MAATAVVVSVTATSGMIAMVMNAANVTIASKVAKGTNAMLAMSSAAASSRISNASRVRTVPSRIATVTLNSLPAKNHSNPASSANRVTVVAVAVAETAPVAIIRHAKTMALRQLPRRT